VQRPRSTTALKATGLDGRSSVSRQTGNGPLAVAETLSSFRGELCSLKGQALSGERC